MSYPSERLPDFIEMDCMGSMCPNYKGNQCSDTVGQWTQGSSTEEASESDETPIRDKAIYIIYGQMCFIGLVPEVVAQRVEVFQPDLMNPMVAVAIANRNVETPVQLIVRNPS